MVLKNVKIKIINFKNKFFMFWISLLYYIQLIVLKWRHTCTKREEGDHMATTYRYRVSSQVWASLILPNGWFRARDIFIDQKLSCPRNLTAFKNWPKNRAFAKVKLQASVIQVPFKCPTIISGWWASVKVVTSLRITPF